MTVCVRLLVALLAMPLAVQVRAASPAQPLAQPPAGERLGTVSFSVSCSAQVRAPFNRGVALLHDFWYYEAQRQFERIAQSEPACAMAHWGIAMSLYHQIWNRPDADSLMQGWAQMQKAAAPPAGTARERAYVAALSRFYEPGTQDYQARVEAYSAAMGELHRRYPTDVDAAAFYALSVLAAEAPGDTSLTQQHLALAVLTPLYVRYPDHPGLVHYTIHACDTPSLAPQGLAAARHYGEIASSGAHAVHMPGHIFARLGMWREDIDSNLASVAAALAAQQRGEGDGMDQFHSDDFLLYAFLQSGQEARAKSLMDEASVLLAHLQAMPGMSSHFMQGMFPYYRSKFPAFYALELRDWKAAAALEPIPGAKPDAQTLTYWARIVGRGHLRQAQEARADLAAYESLLEQVRKGEHAYYADSTAARIERGEILAWVAFAEGKEANALDQMRKAADLQDKVGQGEVDIPAREMLADMLLEFHHPEQALGEYQRSLEHSPNRFNGLFNAGFAAEAAGDRAKARSYYAALLKSTDNGSKSQRAEFEHARGFVSAAQIAAQ